MQDIPTLGQYSKFFMEGVKALLHGGDEPYCMYEPNTRAYKEWTNGFCFRIRKDGSIDLNAKMPEL